MFKSKRLLLLHSIAVVIFLSLPILASPDFNEGIKLFQITPFLNQFLRQVLVLAFFYLNFYFFIPNYYFTEKKWKYLAIVIGCAIIVMYLPDLLFQFPQKNVEPQPYFKNLSPQKPNFLFSFISNGLLQFVLVFVLSLLLKLNDRINKIKTEKLNAELSYLKAQINPHFLFNTLNSLYALTLKKSDDAPEALLKLSNIMRYTTTESSKKYVALENELAYVKDYISLQKLRLNENTNLEFKIEGNTKSHKIAPFIFINFIENAFKFGIDPEEKSEITIVFTISETAIELLTENTIVNPTKISNFSTEEGIKNTKTRLNYLYTSKHKLTISESGNKYKVTLKIDLND